MKIFRLSGAVVYCGVFAGLLTGAGMFPPLSHADNAEFCADMRQRGVSPLPAVCTVPPSPTPSPSPSPSPTVAGCENPGTNSQLAAYCAAGKNAQDASEKNKKLTVVYAGVAAVCGTACMTTAFFGDGVCTVASVGAGLTDAVMTKNFMSGMMSLGSAGASMYMNGGDLNFKAGNPNVLLEDKGGNTWVGNDPSKTKGSKTACITAAVSALQALMKNQNAKSEKDTADSAFEAARRLAELDNSLQFTPIAPITATVGEDGIISNGGNNSIARASAEKVAKPEGMSDPCTSKDFRGTIQCALAVDRNVPSWAGDPAFGKSLQDVTGLSPDAFADKVGNEGPAAAMADGMGAGMTAETKAKLNELIAAADHSLGAGGAYAGGGGGGGGGSGGMPTDLFGNILAQFAQKPEEGKNSGVTGVKFGGPKRFPANVEENRSVSLFDRVTARYHSIHQRQFSSQTFQR